MLIVDFHHFAKAPKKGEISVVTREHNINSPLH